MGEITITEVVKTKGNKELISQIVDLGWRTIGRHKCMDNCFYTYFHKTVDEKHVEQEKAAVCALKLMRISSLQEDNQCTQSSNED